jgi:hypothetical protein
MCKYTEAMSELERLEDHIIELHRDGEKGSTIDLNVFKNLWLHSNNNDFASKDILFSKIKSKDNVLEGFSYLPPNTEVYEHSHENQIEEIRVLVGRLHYEVYKNKNGGKGKLIESGWLNRWEKIDVYPKEYHFLFTSDEDTYLYFKFGKSNERRP